MWQQIRSWFRSPRLSVVVYHAVGSTDTSLSISVHEFEEQLAYFQRHNIAVVSLSEFLEIREGKKKLSRDSVLITFDDGYRDVYQNAWPVLKRYNFPAAIFVNPDFVGKHSAFATLPTDRQRELCSHAELEEMSRGGMAIGNHGYGHRQMDALSDNEIIQEFTVARDWIRINIPINAFPDVFVAPKGNWSSRVARILSKNGLRHAIQERIDVYPGKPIAYFALSLHPIFRWFRDNKSFVVSVVSLVLLKIALGIMLLSNVPQIGLPANYYIATGGDDMNYVQTAAHLLRREVDPFALPIGYSLFLAPLMLLVGVQQLPEIALPAIAANIFVFSNIVLIITMLTIRYFWKKPAYWIIGGLLYIAFPYAWYLLFSHVSLVNVSGAVDYIGLAQARHLFGVVVLSDWFGAVLVGIGMYALLKRYYAWGGALLGMAVMTRAQNGFLALAMAAVIGVTERYWKPVVRYGIWALIGMLPQLVYNVLLTGSPFIFGAYTANNNISIQTNGFSVYNILLSPLRILDHAPYAAIPLVLFCVVIVTALMYFWHSIAYRYFLIAWGIVSPLALFIVASALRNPRYFLPFIPVFMVFLFAAYEYIIKRKHSYYE